MAVTFAHIVNPLMADASSDLFIAQPITFETMRRAQALAAPDPDVALFSAQYREDRPVVPPFFEQTPDLDRSVLDVGEFKVRRKLPLLRDILDRLYEASDADYFVYTNVDIALQSEFYRAVDGFIKSGCDAFVINRRTIPDTFTTVEQLDAMYAHPGVSHRGWDCFIFPRDSYHHFELFDVCLGAGRVGLALLANLVALSSHFRELGDEHLTFHIGDARHWLRKEYAEYDAHNTLQLTRILSALETKHGPFSPESIPGSFLGRRRAFGRFYDHWSRYGYLPLPVSQFLNRVAGRRDDKE